MKNQFLANTSHLSVSQFRMLQVLISRDIIHVIKNRKFEETYRRIKLRMSHGIDATYRVDLRNEYQ